MNIKENPDFINTLEQTRQRGKSMARELLLVFSRMGFDVRDITKHGVICTYVGDGPEIVAFSQFSPPVFIISEPITPAYLYTSLYTSDEPVKSEVLKELIGERYITLVRGFHSDAFLKAKQANIMPALVTNLNLLPGTLEPEFVRSALEILKPDGLVLISAGNNRDVFEFERFTNLHFNDYKTHIFTIDDLGFSGISGEAFLGIFKAL